MVTSLCVEGPLRRQRRQVQRPGNETCEIVLVRGVTAVVVRRRYPSSFGETCFPSHFPFHELPDVLLSSHCSSWTRHMLAARVGDAAENVRRLAEGQPPINIAGKGAA